MATQTIQILSVGAVARGLDARSAQLTYWVSSGIRETSIAVGPESSLLIPESPYDQQGPSLQKYTKMQDEHLYESIYFGALGSASVLKLIGHVHHESRLDKLILEHCKLHALLQESFSATLQAHQLSANERQVLLLAAHGLTASEIAAETKKTVRAVEYLLLKAKKTLNATNLSEAIFRAISTHQLKY